MDERINILPSGGSDTATAMAMMNNNPWMYLVMLALFGNGGWGGNRANGALDIETQNKLNSLQSQINDNNNNAWAREAITNQGNRADFAISQLAQNIGVGVGELRGAISGVKDALFAVSSKNDLGFAGVVNAINLGNLNMIQQMKDCCCAQKQLTISQGYENQIRTLQQTNDLTTAMRVESGLTRTEVAAFRQAWENSRYQDVVAEKTRLQTELDLLRQSQGTQAAIAGAVTPVATELQNLKMQLQMFINTYGGAKTTTAGA